MKPTAVVTSNSHSPRVPNKSVPRELANGSPNSNFRPEVIRRQRRNFMLPASAVESRPLDQDPGLPPMAPESPRRHSLKSATARKRETFPRRLTLTITELWLMNAQIAPAMQNAGTRHRLVPRNLHLRVGAHDGLKSGSEPRRKEVAGWQAPAGLAERKKWAVVSIASGSRPSRLRRW